MRMILWMLTRASASCALMMMLSAALNAGTIIKLNLGGVGPDVAMNDSGVLGTVSDGIASTTGDQNTAVVYTDFLAPQIADILSSTASFSMAGLQRDGFAQLSGPSIIQGYIGGTMNLYDSSNNLLLSGNLNTSALVGNIGPNPPVGTVFSTSFGTITGGSLQNLPLPILANTLALTVTLTDVNGGAGLSVGATAPILQAFSADASVSIEGSPDPSGNIPEPTSIVLIFTATFGLYANRRWR